MLETKKPRKKAIVTGVKPAGQDHQVTMVSGGGGGYRRKPCGNCPWRKDATGVFPAEAFRHSANTSYDLSQHSFGCHESGTQRPATCAGFLLRGAEHNLAVRLGIAFGRFKNDVSDAGLELYENYREMAIANGVDPNDPILSQCRD